MGPNTEPDHADPAFRSRCRARLFLGYTSNLVSAGVREHIKWVGAWGFGVFGAAK